MRSQIKSGKENVSDALLDCGGWAERKRKRERIKERQTEKK